MAARRNVQRHLQQDANREIAGTDAETEDVQVPEPPALLQVPEPPPLPQEDLFQAQKRHREQTITSNTYKRAAATTRHCIFSDCQNAERLLVPRVVKETILGRCRIYVPPSARVCNYHLNNDCWEEQHSKIV